MDNYAEFVYGYAYIVSILIKNVSIVFFAMIIIMIILKFYYGTLT